ncbi:MAG: polysaccharide deacetylase family protein [Gemmatimonadales bacterium]
MTTFRGLLKLAGERILLHSGPARWGLRKRVGDTLILAYHNIRPDGGAPIGDVSLHLRLGSFIEQLDSLMATHEVVPLVQALRPSETPRPRAVITFDDAYQGALTLGIPALAQRGLPATVFVAPGFLGGKSFWWDALAGPDGSGLADGIRRHGLEVLAGRDSHIRAWAASEGCRIGDMPAWACAAHEDELRTAASQPGISLGSHTWDHVNLTALEGQFLADQLSRPDEWLRARFPGVVRWVSYPYGLGSPVVERAAAAAGYEAAARIDGGWIRPGMEAARRYSLPRLNIPAGLSIDGFRLRLAGLFCH